jgi:transcriptional regulator GlxA family with amidase domain
MKINTVKKTNQSETKQNKVKQIKRNKKSGETVGGICVSTFVLHPKLLDRLD